MMTVRELKSLLYAMKDDTVLEVVAEGDMACICEGFEGRKIKGLFITNNIKLNDHDIGTATNERGFLLLEELPEPPDAEDDGIIYAGDYYDER